MCWHQTKSRSFPASGTICAGFAASCGFVRPCCRSHKAAAVSKGMTETVYGELMSIVGVANLTNRLAAGYQVLMNDKFK